MSNEIIPVKLVKVYIVGALFGGALLSVFVIYSVWRAIALSKEAAVAIVISGLSFAHPGIIGITLSAFRKGMDKYVYRLSLEDESSIRARKKYISRWIRVLVLSISLPFSILLFLSYRVLGFSEWPIIFIGVLGYPIAAWFMLNIINSKMDQYPK
jgi:hypothetical protein